ncbi:hypothetical protein EDB86DRAFT_841298 [Lactarius hatsudake]|nr:hypothetical protein EDB86DRAFT_841298 [Lactarius hatsudake]
MRGLANETHLPSQRRYKIIFKVSPVRLYTTRALRQSRYNALPRRKYAHIERPQDSLSLDVEDLETVSGQYSRVLVPRLDGVPLQATVQNLILVDSEARTEVTSIRKRLGAELKPKFATLVEHMYNFNTSLARASIIYNATRAQELLRDMDFIYPEPRTSCDPYRHPIIQRAIDTTWFRNEDDTGVVDREHFSPMPISVIAITLTVIEWCIRDWSDGTQRDSSWDDEKFQTVYDLHISSLLEWAAPEFQEHGSVREREVLYQLQCDLSRNALEHAGVSPDSVTGSPRSLPGDLDVVQEEDDDLPSSAASPNHDGDIPSITIDFA